jgi:hypothetical protein
MYTLSSALQLSLLPSISLNSSFYSENIVRNHGSFFREHEGRVAHVADDKYSCSFYTRTTHDVTTVFSYLCNENN